MPKVVDAEQRREAVVDAVFRLAEREGLHRVSLRAVAVEAGLNIGSVRHYFDGQHELLRFAMRSVIDRVTGRLERRRAAMPEPSALTTDEALTERAALLAELLPLDGPRRQENTVLLEFLVAARSDPALDDLAREAVEGVRAIAARVLARIDVPDLDAEAQRLAALIDGLVLRCVLQPGLLAPDTAVAVLRAHLASLE
jgi:DNA-binding transcriptional regulator YbjK